MSDVLAGFYAVIVGVSLIFLAVFFYLLPTYIAYRRKCVSLSTIFLINFLLGWSGIAYLAVFIWAIVGETKQQQNMRIQQQQIQQNYYQQQQMRQQQQMQQQRMMQQQMQEEYLMQQQMIRQQQQQIQLMQQQMMQMQNNIQTNNQENFDYIDVSNIDTNTYE